MEYQKTYDIIRQFMEKKIYFDRDRVTALHYCKDKKNRNFINKCVNHLDQHFLKTETRLNKQDILQYANKTIQLSINDDFTNVVLSMNSIRKDIMKNFPENKNFWAYQTVFIIWNTCVCRKVYELNSDQNTLIDYIIQETINIVSSEIRNNNKDWNNFLNLSVHGLLIPVPNAFKFTLLIGLVILVAFKFMYRNNKV